MYLEFLSALPGFLAEIAVKLFSLWEPGQKRERVGELLLNIADCIERMGSKIENREIPTIECAELKQYVDGLYKHIKDETNEETARSITLELYISEAVPGYYNRDYERDLYGETKPRLFHRKKHLNEIRRIAGEIRGIGNRVKAGTL